MPKHILIVAGIVVLIALGVFIVAEQNDQQGGDAALSQEEAIQAIIQAKPELSEYQTSTLPPRRIETQYELDGWYVAFVTEGSGIPSVLDAQCYFVSEKTGVQTVGEYRRSGSDIVERVSLTTCAPIVAGPAQNNVLPYGPVTLSIGERARFATVSILPEGIVEDSRCPQGAQCIQAGTVRVRLQTVTPLGTSTQVVTLGTPMTTETESITLSSVLPYPRISDTAEGSIIGASEYRLTFTVQKRTDTMQPPVSEPAEPAPGTPTGACYRGGCSGQICSDQKDVVSTCEFREEYACYQSAACERQANGQCGWTPSPKLTQCLAGRP